MKQLLPVVLLVFCYSCNSESIQEIPYTIIKGKIKSNPISRNNISRIDVAAQEKRRKKINLITNAIRSGLNVPNHNGILDKDGNFHFLVKVEKPTEIRLQHHIKHIPIYVNPGDEITINIDYTKEGNPHTIEGSNTDINQEISTYYQLFMDSFEVELNATLPYVIPREFKEQRAKITTRIQLFTDKYIQENATNNTILANWVKNHSNYRIAMDYMKYAFKVYGFNRFSPDLKDGFPKHYFDFWEDFPVNNPSAITSLNYQNYLQFYRKYLIAKLRQTAPYQDCVNLPTCNEFEMEVAQLTQTLTHKTKDITLSQQADYHLIRNNEAFLKAGFDLYLNEIRDSSIQKALLARKDFLYTERPFKFPENATLIQSNGTGNEILQQITDRHRNRSTLLYFWNTQREITWFFGYKTELQRVWKRIDTLNFDLVLLAHHSTPNIWKEKIVELGLIEDNYHLTDKQFAFFEDYFYENRQPHFNYDKILDRENFMLMTDENGQLTTLDEISFRENSFTWLNHLPNRLKWSIERQKRTQIMTDNKK